MNARSIAATRKRIHKALDTYLDAVLLLDKLKQAVPRDVNAIADAARANATARYDYTDEMGRITGDEEL